MKTVQVFIVLAISLGLSGCFARYHNTEEAYAPFPEIPANPDGVCPDLTGTYYKYACPEEPGGGMYVDFLNNHLGEPIFSEEVLAQARKNPPGPPSTPIPKCSPPPVITSIVSVRYLAAEKKYEARTWNAEMTRSVVTFYDLGKSKPTCDKGVRYGKDKGENYGVESGSTYKSISTVSKTAEGDLVYKRYIDQALYAFKTIPMGGTHTIHTYRFKVYHGSIPRAFALECHCTNPTLPH